MKALTICQPYAHLIVSGEKRIENREWSTKYRGKLVIHAGKSRDWLTPGDEQRYHTQIFGYAIGIADLVDVLHIDKIKRGDYDNNYPWLRKHNHTHGKWCWVLENCQKLTPIQRRGAQGLWNLPDGLFQFNGARW